MLILLLLFKIYFQLLFETKAIYIYPWINLVLPLAASGLNNLITLFKGVHKVEKKEVNI